MNSYELSRIWFDWCFENPDKINPNHTALYFFAIEHCNRLGWKEKFGLPTQMSMDAIGVKNWRTFSKAFNDLVDWGFFKVITKSKNQYSATVIAIVKNTEANTKALTKAMQKHAQKHSSSIVVIDKLLNQETIKQEDNTYDFIDENFNDCFFSWLDYKKEKKQSYKSPKSIKQAYENLLKLSNNNPAIAAEIVKQSIGNNWAGLFELKNQDKNGKLHKTNPGGSRQPSTADEHANDRGFGFH